jgi:hypothetical protein
VTPAARRRILSAASALALLAAAERRALAGDNAFTGLKLDLDFTALYVAVGIALAVDSVFVVYDVRAAVQGQLPARGWSIAETVVSAPQTAFANVCSILLNTESDRRESVAALVLPIAIGSMTTHGIWSTATPDVRPLALFGYSPLISTNASLSAVAIGRAARRRRGTRTFGVVEAVLTAPQIALGGVQMVHDPSNRALWIGHTAWTSALLVHGIASIAAGRDEPPPPPPPLPPPVEVPIVAPVPQASFHVGPGMVSDGVARVPGITVVGVF